MVINELRSRYERDVCIPIFIAALIIIVKTWKQMSIDRCMDFLKMWYTQTMEYYSAIQKRKKYCLCDNMNGPGRHYSKWNKLGKERQIKHDLTFVWNMKLLTSQKQRVEWNCQGLEEGEEGGYGQRVQNFTYRK